MIPHPHIAARKVAGPPKHADQVNTWNARLALRITRTVGTMTCAWIFAAIALVSLPAAVLSGSPIIIVAWLSQAMLQLVLLPIIIVGTNMQAAASDARSQATFDDATAILATVLHVAGQQDVLDTKLTGFLTASAQPGGTLTPPPENYHG